MSNPCGFDYFDYMDYCMNILCKDCNCKKGESVFGYIYLLRQVKKIEINSNSYIPFTNNGELKGILHDPATNKGIITIQSTGYYEINYYVDDRGEKKSFALDLNGEIQGSRYSPNTASSIVYGQVIIKVTSINSIIKIVNTDSGTFTFNALTNADDPKVVLASIFIEKIGDI